MTAVSSSATKRSPLKRVFILTAGTSPGHLLSGAREDEKLEQEGRWKTKDIKKTEQRKAQEKKGLKNRKELADFYFFLFSLFRFCIFHVSIHIFHIQGNCFLKME